MIGRWLGIQKDALDHVKHSEGFKTTSEKATICIEPKELTDKKCAQKGEKRHKMKFFQDMGTKFFQDMGSKFFQDVGRGPPNGRRRQSDDRDD